MSSPFPRPPIKKGVASIMKATIWKRGAGLFAALLLVGGASGLLTLGEEAETAAGPNRGVRSKAGKAT